MPHKPPRSGRPEYRKAGLQKTTPPSVCKGAGAQGNNRSKEMLKSPHPHPDPDPAGPLRQAKQPTTGAAPAARLTSFLRHTQAQGASWGPVPLAVSLGAAPLAALLVLAPSPALANRCYYDVDERRIYHTETENGETTYSKGDCTDLVMSQLGLSSLPEDIFDGLNNLGNL